MVTADMKMDTHLIENNAPCPTVCIDFNSTTIKGGFAGELAIMWEMPSQYGVAKNGAENVVTKFVYGDIMNY